MDILKTNQEVVHEGWLIKSPPTKLWKARWRQRWFTLRHSGELPGQYFLEYYTERRCRKLKGRIDLDQCEQVDAGLSFENRKEKYQYMFNVKTPKRIYYLVAENEADMNKWVDAICQVCGLKAYTQDEDQQCQSNFFPFESQESPPLSPTSIMSGPYIPISECISGSRFDNISFSTKTNVIDNHDVTRRLVPSPPRSPTTDAESIVTDDEWISLPNVNWDTFPSTGEVKPCFKPINAGIGSWSVKKRFGKLRIIDSNTLPTADKIPIPPRPPKPIHMIAESPSHNYLNLNGATESSKPTTSSILIQSSITTDNNNSALLEKISSTSIKAEINLANTIPKYPHNFDRISLNRDDHVFQYDFDNNEHINTDAACSATYTNVANILNKDNADSMSVITESPPTPPPMIYRELKPGKKLSDSNINNELSSNAINKDLSLNEQIHAEPPSINRKLKPILTKSTTDDSSKFILISEKAKDKSIASPIMKSKMQKCHHTLISDDTNNAFEEKEEIYFYQDNDTFVPASDRRLLVLQYLDLDLETTETLNNSVIQPPQSPLAPTVYKTVDFLKTEAFNRTRQRVEEERKQCTDELI